MHPISRDLCALPYKWHALGADPTRARPAQSERSRRGHYRGIGSEFIADTLSRRCGWRGTRMYLRMDNVPGWGEDAHPCAGCSPRYTAPRETSEQ